MYASWLWVAFTLTASAAQTARNVMQRELTEALGALGASQVRFLFGLPFAILFFVGLRLATGVAAPTIGPAAAGFIVMGALAQIGGTALMLAAMRERSFVVVIAFTKTEAAQVALYALLFLGETPTVKLVGAIALATVGVFLMAGSRRRGRARRLAADRDGARFGDLLRLRRRRLSRRGDAAWRRRRLRWRRRRCWSPASPFRPPCCWSGSPCSTAPGSRRSWRCGARRCSPVSWARWLRNCGSSLSRSPTRRGCARWRWSRCCSPRPRRLRLFRERPSAREWLGMALIVAAAAVLIGG